MKGFLSETPFSLDRPIGDEDGRRLIDVLVDPDEGPAVPEDMASSETQTEMLRLLASLKPIEGTSSVLETNGSALGSSRPAIIRKVVVLPQPEGPRSTTNSPFSTARSMPFTARVPSG